MRRLTPISRHISRNTRNIKETLINFQYQTVSRHYGRRSYSSVCILNSITSSTKLSSKVRSGDDAETVYRSNHVNSYNNSNNNNNNNNCNNNREGRLEHIGDSIEFENKLTKTFLLKIREHKYNSVIRIIYKYHKKPFIESSDNLESIIQELVSLNQKRLAFEFIKIHEEMIIRNVQCFKPDTLIVFLELIYIFQRYEMFDKLFSYYINNSDLDLKTIQNAISFYIKTGRIEFAKQLLYQMSFYFNSRKDNNHDNTDVEFLLYSYLTSLEKFRAPLVLFEFGFNTWKTQKLSINNKSYALMMDKYYLSKNNDKIEKFKRYLQEINKNDVIEVQLVNFYEILRNGNLSEEERYKMILEWRNNINSLNDSETLTLFYKKIIDIVSFVFKDIDMIRAKLLPLISADNLNNTVSIYLSISNYYLHTRDFDGLVELFDKEIIEQKLPFTYRHLRMVWETFMNAYPDYGKHIETKDLVEKFVKYDLALSKAWVRQFLNSIQIDKHRYNIEYAFGLRNKSNKDVVKLIKDIDEMDKLTATERVSKLIQKSLENGVNIHSQSFISILEKYLKLSNNIDEVGLSEINQQLATLNLEVSNRLKLAFLKKKLRLIEIRKYEVQDQHLDTRILQSRVISNFVEDNVDESFVRKDFSELCDILIDFKFNTEAEEILNNKLKKEKTTADTDLGYDQMLLSILETKLYFNDLKKFILSVEHFKSELLSGKVFIRKFYFQHLKVSEKKFKAKFFQELRELSKNENQNEAFEKKKLVYENFLHYFHNFIKLCVQNYAERRTLERRKFYQIFNRYLKRVVEE
ncbi:hypothetical protein PACTADRAFT_882 [Pachysolen tannophilus NRRL Y-2460]|uniref:Uncharacterized protein n=1 Tax=Pachysolen tannophilus NRRL Y-2460 TaxID=669874 RepID=A0A1E4U332_PACTA|nr:hypothetical protein PACTADRAFT_882 [Pachysolen tannophilus NRRL Y-2460]